MHLVRLQTTMNNIPVLMFLLLLSVLPGCSTMSAAGLVVNLASAALGMKTDDNKPTEIDLSIHAAPNLNTSGNTGTAAVTRIYYLKTLDTWSNLNMEQMINQDNALGTSLIESREIILMPNRQYTNVEKVPKEANYIGISTFFHAAPPQRWKYAFDVKEARKSGLVLGAHACALTVQTGQPILPPGLSQHDPKSLAFIQCNRVN